MLCITWCFMNVFNVRNMDDLSTVSSRFSRSFSPNAVVNASIVLSIIILMEVGLMPWRISLVSYIPFMFTTVSS